MRKEDTVLTRHSIFFFLMSLLFLHLISREGVASDVILCGCYGKELC